MIRRIALAAVLASLMPLAALADWQMWYRQPALNWMEAMPLGNGRLSAMVYGGVKAERVALNEISLWAGQPDTTDNMLCDRDKLDEMRALFFAGDAPAACALGEQCFSGSGRHFGTHLPLGDLVIDFGHGAQRIDGYRRELSLDSALAMVSYEADGVGYRRESFVSHPHGVMAMRISASRQGALNATVGLQLLRHADIEATADGLWLEGQVSHGTPDIGGVAFCGFVRLLPEGGTVTPGDSTVSVSGANALTIIIDVRTDYMSGDYRAQCVRTVEAAVAHGYDALRSAHRADHSALFGRMDLTLGGGTGQSLPTDTRLRMAKAGLSDASFDALFFQYGRYMLIASSRPNGTPLCANLQGVWNDNRACNMVWNCDYHLDINIQQNYWSANRANLAECNEPLFAYIAFLAEHGAATARQMYGSGGWVAHTVCNAWGYTGPGWGVSWGMNVTAGAWLATHLWSHYLYTRDTEWLRREGYPLLRSTAQFFIDYMAEHPASGYLVTGPSISPENGYVSPGGQHLSLAMMPTIDRAVVYDIYSACIQASRILGVDKALRRRLETDIRRLPPLMVGSDGQVQEWLDDVRRSDPSHRHSSHLVALFPLGQISPAKTPQLAEAARLALAAQTASEGWEDTEWSTANMLCFHARLKDAQAAYGWLQNLFKRFTRENLMTVSPAGVAMAECDIFSFDATEASVAGMCEMLQSYDGCLDFLPALPREWADGHVRGLCAEGGLVVDMEWQSGRMTRATITAKADCTFSVKGRQGSVSLKRGEATTIVF